MSATFPHPPPAPGLLLLQHLIYAHICTPSSPPPTPGLLLTPPHSTSLLTPTSSHPPGLLNPTSLNAPGILLTLRSGLTQCPRHPSHSSLRPYSIPQTSFSLLPNPASLHPPGSLLPPPPPPLPLPQASCSCIFTSSRAATSHLTATTSAAHTSHRAGRSSRQGSSRCRWGRGVW